LSVVGCLRYAVIGNADAFLGNTLVEGFHIKRRWHFT
jgi:hypothetical protein